MSQTKDVYMAIGKMLKPVKKDLSPIKEQLDRISTSLDDLVTRIEEIEKILKGKKVKVL
jgi:archaellum component FlaC